jgi:hypothetical protein
MREQRGRLDGLGASAADAIEVEMTTEGTEDTERAGKAVVRECYLCPEPPMLPMS